ncbi:hypothetical protein P691DRAFT_790596 [Macrolepiota fuliginosa MF-IS2]|uniref:Uncharacterized protein n=1 Tax=Macrolepiota fuliginosa MF-IS2 TaxID=1400762 RepID=A0A9P5XE59_9AGAR|nr:hypothetical protein P691DRAFT_790596 [Macrolepiota fuliginosa MF-IS2]
MLANIINFVPTQALPTQALKVRRSSGSWSFAPFGTVPGGGSSPPLPCNRPQCPRANVNIVAIAIATTTNSIMTTSTSTTTSVSTTGTTNGTFTSGATVNTENGGTTGENNGGDGNRPLKGHRRISVAVDSNLILEEGEGDELSSGREVLAMRPPQMPFPGHGTIRHNPPILDITFFQNFNPWYFLEIGILLSCPEVMEPEVTIWISRPREDELLRGGAQGSLKGLLLDSEFYPGRSESTSGSPFW